MGASPVSEQEDRAKMNKSHCVKSLLAGLILAAPAVWAQGNGQPAANQPTQPPAVAPAQKPDFSAERAEMKALNEQERAELKAVNTSSQTPVQKRDARKAIREKYKDQRLALRKKYHGDAMPTVEIRQNRQHRRMMQVKPAAPPKTAQ